MWALGVVEREIVRQMMPSVGYGLIGMQIDMLVLDAAPEALDEDIVKPAALAVHADPDRMVFQYLGKFDAGELTALVGVEDFWRSVVGDGLFERLDAEV